PRLNVCGGNLPFDQPALRHFGRLVAVPEAVMDVLAPKEPIKERRQIVMRLNRGFLNGGADDHRQFLGVPNRGGASFRIWISWVGRPIIGAWHDFRKPTLLPHRRNCTMPRRSDTFSSLLALASIFALWPARADDKVEPGFVPLFNGKDLTGWKAINGKMERWGAENGLLFVQGGGG